MASVRRAEIKPAYGHRRNDDRIRETDILTEGSSAREYYLPEWEDYEIEEPYPEEAGIPARYEEDYPVEEIIPADALSTEEAGEAGEVQGTADKALFRMNFLYLGFLTLAAVISVWVLVNYLQLKETYTGLQKSTTSLENQISRLRVENNAQYNRIMSKVDLEEVRQKAVGKLGMVYATADQIVFYDTSEDDFVKQYLEIPEG